MWQLIRVQAKNIVSFQELDLVIPQNVCTLIYGINADNENQKNNGSGKSSIIEAIAFGITGESIKKAPSLNDIINNYAEEASVRLTFYNDWDDSRLIVCRDITREGSQKITVQMDKAGRDEDECTSEEIVQSSVLEYNRYILQTLGVTKDELYGCYLLNNARFKSFFLASDKEKKEIINTFSNGVLVDQAIDQLQESIDVSNFNLMQAKDIVTKYSGSLSAVDEQIVAAETKALYAEQDKQNKIADLKSKIAGVRTNTQSEEEKKVKADERMGLLDNLLTWLDRQEEAEQEILDSYQNIHKKFIDLSVPQIKDYSSLVAEKNKEIQSAKNDAMTFKATLEEDDLKLKILLKKKIEANKLLEDAQGNNKLKMTNDEIAKLNRTLDDMDEQAAKLEDKIAASKKSIAKVNETINKLEVQIGGAVTCPHCKTKFLLDPEKSLADLQLDLADKKDELDKLEKVSKMDTEKLEKVDDDYNKKLDKVNSLKDDIKTFNDNIVQCQDKLRKAERDYEELYDQSEVLERKIKSNQQKLDSFDEDMAMLKNRMFDEANENVESRIKAGKAYIETINSTITANNGIIEAYKQSIKDIENAQADADIISNLKASKKKYEEHLSEAQKVLAEKQGDYDKLVSQKDYFTQFKSYLANKKIDSIAAITNQFLGKIGSDMSIELSGYKVLKSKKVREKITMSILRDGVDGGPLEKFSGGEKARIMLAGILAMMHLTNKNCEDGKGLNLAVIDELLDASDTSGIMSYAEAITSLGITSLLITQCPVNESYPNLLTVKKEGGFSTLL